MHIVCTKREYHSSNSAEDYDPITGACSIEKFASSKDRFRVAPALKLPTPAPYDSRRCSEEVRDQIEVLFDKLLQTATLSGISCETINVYNMWQRGFPETAKNTIIISTLDADPTGWNAAAMEIYNIVEQALPNLLFRVEIQNPDRMYSDVSLPIRDKGFLEILSEITPGIEAEVERSCVGLCTSIAFHSRRRHDAHEDPGRPTIIISIQPKSVSLWGVIEDRLCRVIESVESARVSEITLEILPGFNVPAITPAEVMLRGSARYHGRIPTSPENGS